MQMAMSGDSTTTTIKDAVSQEVQGHEALMRLMPELKAMRDEDVLLVQLDIPSAVATVLGSLPEILALRSEVEAKTKEFDLRYFDQLEDCALALSDAHTEYLTATKPMDDLEQLVEEGNALRAKFEADANASVLHGLLDGKKLAELQGGVGYKNLASDLSIYAKVFLQSWTQIQNKVGTTAADVERAGKLAQRLVRVVGLREQSTQAVAEATDIRARAYSLLLRVYDEVRRAIAFLRWAHKDADEIAPSLFTTRQRRKGTASPDPATATATATAPTAASTNPTATLPAQPAAAQAAQQPPGDGQTAPGAGNSSAGRPGPIPGGEPFIS